MSDFVKTVEQLADGRTVVDLNDALLTLVAAVRYTGKKRWQDVAQLALTHPVVYRAVSHHHAGDLTREEALSVMVLALAEALSDTQEHLARLLASLPRPTRQDGCPHRSEQ